MQYIITSLHLSMNISVIIPGENVNIVYRQVDIHATNVVATKLLCYKTKYTTTNYKRKENQNNNNK